MKNTSEFPDATEQTQTPVAKPRQTARPRPEAAPAVNQEPGQGPSQSPNQGQGPSQGQAPRAPRRRPTPPANGPTVANGTENTTAPTQRPPMTQQNTTAPTQRPPMTQQNVGAPTQRPPMTQRPPLTQQGGNRQGPGQGQGQGGYGHAPYARSTGAPNQGQRPGQGQGAPSQFPRPNPNGPGSQPMGPRTGNGPQRSYGNNGNGPVRPGNGPQRPSTNTNAPTQSGPRPNTSRPGGGGNSNYGPNRSGGSHGPGNRSGGRPATPAQRPAERRAPAVKEKPTGPISIPAQVVVKDLAEMLRATPNEVIRILIKNGTFASINEVVEYDKAALVAQEIGFEPSQSAAATPPEGKLSANEEMIVQRDTDKDSVVIPPVVTIMGHVDHGKTSLLDTIRKTKVAAGEAGGITQHIGAYQVEINGKKITFLDTPGHEAFTAMRARGAQATHIAVIVVAADDGVMPQTREAIDHALAAKVPIVIALNKIDKDNANPDHVKQQLAEMGVIIEEYGGDVGCIPVSARKGIGIDELLEYILLLAEVQDIRANPNRPATGIIVEAKLEKNIGPMATVLVQQGTLKMGDNIVVGALSGKVRAMYNDRGKRIQKAPPSTPVSITGLSEVPQAGDRLEVAPDERTAKQRALTELEKREDETGPLGQVSLDTLYMQMQQGKVKELNVILKCDVQGSSEAIKNALSKLGEDNLKVRMIHEGIGNISETDVHLASASGAIIIGFNVKADGASLREAQKEHVDIRYYNVIYKLTDDIEAALTGMLEPTYHEVIEGHAEVLQLFKAGKTTVIAGCRILDGKITRSSKARITRKSEKVFDGLISSLRRGKDDVREIATGYECGIVLEDFIEFEVGDIIEAYNKERVKAGQ